jgi:hypothetical protein
MIAMSPVLSVLSSESSAASDQAFCNFARFLGLRTELAPLRGELTEPPQALRAPAPGGRVLAFGCAALRQLVQRGWFASLLEETRFIFVYGFQTEDGESPELKWLTRGALTGVTSIEAGRKHFTVHADVTYGNFPVSGKSYSAEVGPTAVFSDATRSADIERYITANGHPLFVCAKRGQSLLFLFTEAELVDVDRVFAPEVSLRSWYAQLIAMTIFLRSALGTWCWTAPVTGATFTVDDPWLKKSYGFVNYKALVSELDRTESALTIGFIPYNYRRSDPETVALLGRHSDRFSIAVHGCDHTGGEFASLDEAWLTGTAAYALERMQAHTGRTRMPFDNVMIFPQGQFSTKAIRALKTCGFAAAVNSTPWPVDYWNSPLTLRDLLDVATTRHDNFPIFARRYPQDIFEYAFDALFQKPVLAVEHHGFFRHGYEPLANFVRDLSTLNTNLAWMPLGKTVAASFVCKQTGDGQMAIRHFAPVLRYKNPTPAEVSLAVEKPEQEGVVEAVLLGNQKIPFEVHSGLLRYAVQLEAGEELNLSVVYRRTPRASRRPSWKYGVAASVRRMLSDVRDNYLARSERVLSIAEKIKNKLAYKKRLRTTLKGPPHGKGCNFSAR